MLNFRKSYQIWGNWLKNKNVRSEEQTGGGKDPPSAYRVKRGSWSQVYAMFKVVVRAEVPYRDFLQTPEHYYL